ncbi:MAG TPA: O-antigen ligase family protein [Candidatus Limnocylindria bacterium]|nr:O-antigen ligase family protein [Candidatus Limnocylindria bacterium]
MSRRIPLTLAAALAALAYGVLLGGTGLGELHPVLRVINMAVGGSLVAAYLVLAPRRMDRVDALTLLALLLFLVPAVLSAYPRQSLDSALGALVFVAALFVARRVTAGATGRRATILVVCGLSAVLALLAAARWLPDTIEWWRLTSWTVTPPLDMDRSGMLWGHRHDLALLPIITAPAWWIGDPGPIRRAAGAVFTALALLLVVLDGSRTIWLALVLATLVVAVPRLAARWRPSRATRTVAIASVAMGAIGMTVSGIGSAALDRLLTTNTLASRADLWSSATDVFLGRPLTGAGPGSFPWLLQRTDYFDANSWAPRHPDSLPFQALPELGLFGVAAILVVAVAIVPGVWRGPWQARWAIGAMAFASVGTNPSEFAFFVLLAIAWVAIAAPSIRAWEPLERRDLVGAVRFASLGALLVVGIAASSTAVAAFAYADGRAAVARGSLPEAHDALAHARSLDPGMALYVRQQGAVSLVAGEVDRAVRELETAVAMNPQDDLAWRSLALARLAMDDLDGAAEASARAVATQQSDPTNLLVQLQVADAAGDATTATDAATALVQAWPWLIGADAWSSVAPAANDQLLQSAAQRWGDGTPTPQSNALHALWLAVLAGREDLRPEAIGSSGLPASLAETYAAALVCEPDAEQRLDDASANERRFDEYWAASLRLSSLAGAPDETARRLLEIMSPAPYRPEAAQRALDPLDENGAWGLSGDTWGYRRPPMDWPAAPERATLPPPDAAWIRWTLDPAGANGAAGLSTLEQCSP